MLSRRNGPPKTFTEAGRAIKCGVQVLTPDNRKLFLQVGRNGLVRIDVGKSAYTTFFSLAETSTVLQLTVRDLHRWPVKFFHTSCYRLSCITKENSTFKSRLESVSPAIKLHRFARPQRNTRRKAPPSPSPAPTQRLPIAAMVRLSRQTRHKQRVTDF